MVAIGYKVEIFRLEFLEGKAWINSATTIGTCKLFVIFWVYSEISMSDFVLRVSPSLGVKLSWLFVPKNKFLWQS